MKKRKATAIASSKYSAAGMDYQPGSRGRVLCNKLGITSIRAMNDREIVEYAHAVSSLSEHYSFDHSFTDTDICFIHKTIFHTLYKWAGEYRNVELSKDGFVFARAKFIPQLMKDFSSSILKRNTPPVNRSLSQLSLLLAKIHVEFILIHPFREGNGRTIRLLLTLIAQQAQYAGIDFGFIKEKGKEYKDYIGAIQNGMQGNYNPMKEIIERALSR